MYLFSNLDSSPDDDEGNYVQYCLSFLKEGRLVHELISVAIGTWKHSMDSSVPSSHSTFIISPLHQTLDLRSVIFTQYNVLHGA